MMVAISREALSQLVRLGSLLNQVARHYHQQTALEEERITVTKIAADLRTLTETILRGRPRADDAASAPAAAVEVGGS